MHDFCLSEFVVQRKSTLFMKFLFRLWVVYLLVAVPSSYAQEIPLNDSARVGAGLIYDRMLQAELVDLIEYTYNFDFQKAEKEWRWLQYRYPEHPLPYLVKGLMIWWRMMPNIDKYRYDDEFVDYMDKTIDLAWKYLKKSPQDPEFQFYLAAAHAYKGRLYAERESWLKAAWEGRQAIKYLRREKEVTELSYEFVFGDGLYNFYSRWIHENYPSLRPLLVFFEKGDKQKGIQQLEYVARNAFYTRIEAYYFLTRIYALEENKPYKGLEYAKYLYERYPNNPYFHRFYAMLLFLLGRLQDMEPVAQQLLQRVEAGVLGYEEISGRYATYFLGYKSQHLEGDMPKAIGYYQRTIEYAEAIRAYDSGYYQSALKEIARWAEQNKKYRLAKECYDKLARYGNSKKQRKDAKKAARKYRKIEED